MQFQTIEEFLQVPFGTSEIKSNDYERMYKKLKTAKKIIIAGFTMIEDFYLMHIKIGSETFNGEFYDVVIMFFTDNPAVKKQRTLESYYIKLFSNSPSFIYKYAALYKEHGYLIESFYEKLDPEYADKKPEKTNAEMKLSYDKSIYCAIRYLYDYRFIVLGKYGLLLQKKKTSEAFLKDIKNFGDIKFLQNFKKIEKTVERQMKGTSIKKPDNRKKKTYKSSSGVHIVSSSKRVGISTSSPPSITVTKKKASVSSHTKKPKIGRKK